MNFARIDRLLRGLGPKGASLISLGFLGLLWFVYYLPGDGAAARPRSNDTGASSDTGALDQAVQPTDTTFETLSASDISDHSREVQRNVIHIRNLSAARVLEEGEIAFRDLEAASKEWKTQAASLQNGPIGRKLATDTENLPYLMDLLATGNEQAKEAVAYREQLDLIKVELDEFLFSDSVALVTRTTVEAIEVLGNEIRADARAMQGSLDQLNASIQMAEDLPVGELSLAEAFQAFKSREAEQMRLDQIAARKVAEEEMRERLLEAERAKLEAETRLKQTELAAETARLTAMEEEARIAAEKDQEVIAAKVAQEKLETEFTRDLAEIKRLLSPFVTPAEYKLYPSGSYLYTGDNTGVSLKVIAYTGALEPTDDGIEAMAELGRTEFRPLGTFPKYVKSEWRRSPEVKERLVRAQELLLKYGDLLVKKGMLEK